MTKPHDDIDPPTPVTWDRIKVELLEALHPLQDRVSKLEGRFQTAVALAAVGSTVITILLSNALAPLKAPAQAADIQRMHQHTSTGRMTP